MTDTSTSASTAASPAQSAPSGDRLARFESDLDTIGHRTSKGDRTWALAGAVVMVVGVAITVVAYFTSTSQSDTRDVISSGILASVGLALVVAGAAVFVRSSVTEFLRFWMLRLLSEQRPDQESR